MTKILINGNINTIAIVTEMVLKIVKEARIATGGNTRSKTAISLASLVWILPIGFESKNNILALTIFSIISLCKLVVAVFKIPKMTKLLANVKQIKTKIIIAKIIGYLSSYYYW